MTNHDGLYAYGLIALNDLDSDVIEELLYHKGRDLSYEAARDQEIAEQQAVWEDECESKTVAAQEAGTDLVLDDFVPYLDDFDPQIEEPVHEGEHEGISYRTTWLGGACHLWVFRSPFIELRAGRASPCVPGAGILPGGDGDVAAYTVPPTWLRADVREEREKMDDVFDE